MVGLDIAPRMIEAATRNATRDGLDITFRVQSATDLDDPPGSFDGACWAGSYHHIPGRALRGETLRRIAGALTPDGVLILMVVYRGPRGLLSRSRLVDLLRKAGGQAREEVAAVGARGWVYARAFRGQRPRSPASRMTSRVPER